MSVTIVLCINSSSQSRRGTLLFGLVCVPQHFSMSLSLTLLLVSIELVVCQSTHRTRPYTGPPVIPVILPGGFIADTEEVAKARDTHLRLLGDTATASEESQSEEVQQRYSGVSDQQFVSAPVYQRNQQRTAGSARVQDHFEDSFLDEHYNEDGEYHQHHKSSGSPYRGSHVVPVLLPGVHIHNVEAARQNHLRLAQQKTQQRFAEEVNQQPRWQPWKGPAAVTVVLPDGHLADTPEVADAKIAHLQQLLAAAQQDREKITSLGFNRVK